MSKTAFRLWTDAKGGLLIKRKIGFCGKSKLRYRLDAARGGLKGKVHVILVAVKRENWCRPTEWFEQIHGSFVCRKPEFLHFHLKLSVFSNKNFMSSQKQLFTKHSHSMKHITCCPPKSKLFFFIKPTNPCAVKHASRTGSKYSEPYGTRRRFSTKIFW